MARSRAPKAAAIAGAIARIFGLGASVVLLANLIYESVNWGKTLGLSVSVAVIALVLDGSELMGILDSTRTIPRAPPSCVAFGDLLVLCLATPSIFLIMRSNKHEDPTDESYPWENTDSLSIAVTYALCGLRFVLLIWSCAVCCIVIRQPRRPDSRSTPADSTSELRDVPPVR